MLSYQLLKNHAGLLLVGDYTSLRCLHQVVHEINDRSPLIKEEDGLFLGLAYDVRKAYEQEREILSPPEHYGEVGPRYGVKILWPTILLQQRLLRVSLGYLDHSKWHQAITYALEAVIEDALREDFGREDSAVIDQWQRLDPTHSATLDKLSSRGAIFSSWTKSERKRHLAALMASFDPMYEAYYQILAERGEAAFLSPEELDRWTNLEWPDPRW